MNELSSFPVFTLLENFKVQYLYEEKAPGEKEPGAFRSGEMLR
jgi:hypothetical protein